VQEASSNIRVIFLKSGGGGGIIGGSVVLQEDKFKIKIKFKRRKKIFFFISQFFLNLTVKAILEMILIN